MYFFWPNNNAFDVPKTYLLYQFLSLLAGAAFLISVVCPACLEIGGYWFSAGENGWTLPIPYAQCMVYLPTFGCFLGQMLVNIPYMEHMGIYGGLTFRKKTLWNFMVMVIYGYPKLPEGFQEEKWGTGWRVALGFSKWVDSQTLVRVTE